MNNLFSADNKFFSLMGKVFDVVVLNTVWLLICVPLPMLTIVWIGKTENFIFLIFTMLTLLPVVPATTALYYALVKSVRRERSYSVKEFFRSFLRNFKQGSILTIIFIALVSVLSIDFQYAMKLMEAQNSMGSLYFGVFIVIVLLFGSMYLYVCPILSRFDMKLGGILKTAFLMGAKHLLTTLGLFVLLVVVLLGCYLVLPGIFFLPATAMLLASFLVEPVFKRYMPEKEEVQVDEFGDAIGQTKDEWYLD
jgi:uncharacterized membrane protein YesL